MSCIYIYIYIYKLFSSLVLSCSFEHNRVSNDLVSEGRELNHYNHKFNGVGGLAAESNSGNIELEHLKAGDDRNSAIPQTTA